MIIRPIGVQIPPFSPAQHRRRQLLLVQEHVLVRAKGHGVQHQRRARSKRHLNGLRVETLGSHTSSSLTGGKVRAGPGAAGHGHGGADHLADLVVEEAVSLELDAKEGLIVEGNGRGVNGVTRR